MLFRSAALVTLLPQNLVIISANQPNGPHTPRHALLVDTLRFTSALVADLIHKRSFLDSNAWKRCLGTYLSGWFPHGSEEGYHLADSIRQHFHAVDKVSSIFTRHLININTLSQAKHGLSTSAGDDEEELLCDTLFSLGYGALLLLSQTTLRLVRGRRYGILGTNGSGKTTLMRQLRDGKVENFPPQSELRCVMVEHSLQGEDTSLSIIDFVASGTALVDDRYIFLTFDTRSAAEERREVQDSRPTGRSWL